jgi:uncharacterized membrane protein YfcA
MPGFLLDLVLGFGIGLSLGMLGGGGSILTVPALVYLVGQSPQAAVMTSLAIVGANSMVGAVFHHREGKLNWRVAFLFGGTGMIAAYFAAGISKQLSPIWLLIAFAVLMLIVGSLMFFQKERPDQLSQISPKWWISSTAGVGVGLLTGILGVGGGFLIVPALVMLVGLPMDQAVATSLVIIVANSFAGLMGHLSTGTIDVSLTVIFILAGIVGTLLGTRLAHRLSAQWLRHIFALFVIILGIFLLIDNLPKL